MDQQRQPFNPLLAGLAALATLFFVSRDPVATYVLRGMS